MQATTTLHSDVAASPIRPRLDYLDGVRGLAALFVVAIICGELIRRLPFPACGALPQTGFSTATWR